MAPNPALIGEVRGNPVYMDHGGPFALVSEQRVGVTECSLCGSFEYCGDDVELHGHSICDPCAETVMNLKHHKHSGEYITWPNEPTTTTSETLRKPISPSKRRRVHERDFYACRYCGARQNLVIDHVQPVTRGGTNDLDNLATACHECNQRKFNRTPNEAGMVLQAPKAFA